MTSFEKRLNAIRLAVELLPNGLEYVYTGTFKDREKWANMNQLKQKIEVILDDDDKQEQECSDGHINGSGRSDSRVQERPEGVPEV